MESGPSSERMGVGAAQSGVATTGVLFTALPRQPALAKQANIQTNQVQYTKQTLIPGYIPRPHDV